ncbi:MAG: carbonic anhydrase [Phycisphaerales bacterium]|nr:carbonic anhydrase [Phycisphaerales bacterium]
MIPALEALEILKVGNRRFVAGKSAELHRTHKLVDNQEPFAVVLGCSDSRVPPEIVFDQGVGDMFVIRIAGNIVTPLELGSVEFAAIKFGPRLVVVMGHTCCGAVQATVETLLSGLTAETADLSAGMKTIVEHIGISVNLESDPEAMLNQTIEANVRNSVRSLREQSQVLIDLTKDDGMMIVGAVYDISTGVVEFIDCPEPMDS